MFEDIRAGLQTLAEASTRLLGLGRDISNVDSGQMLLRAIVIYVLALVLPRVGSRRFLSQATAFDVVIGTMLGSILSRAINGSAPLLPTLVAGAALVGLHWFIAVLSYSTSLGSIFKGQPRLLIQDGDVQHGAMRRAAISAADLEEALRLQGHANTSKIRCAYLERNGSISLILYPEKHEVLEISVEDGVQRVRIEFK